MKNILVVLLLLTSLISLSQTLKPHDEDKTVYHNDEPYLVSILDKSTMILKVEKTTTKELTLFIEVKNLGDKVTFNPTDIQVISADKKGDLIYHEVYSKDEYMDKIKRKQDLAAMGMALSLSMQEQGAGYSQTSVNGSVSSSDYSQTSTFNANATTYDRSKELEARERTNDKMQDFTEKSYEKRAGIESQLAGKQTLFTEDQYYGIVKAKVGRRDEAFLISVSLGDETHEYLFSLEN